MSNITAFFGNLGEKKSTIENNRMICYGKEWRSYLICFLDTTVTTSMYTPLAIFHRRLLYTPERQLHPLGNTEIVPLLQILSLVNGGALEVSPDWPKMNSLPQSPSRSETAKTEPWPMDGNRKSVGETPQEDVLCWWKYGVTKEKAISGPSASVLKVTVKPGAMAAFSQWCKANRIGLENRTLMTTARKAKVPSEAALDGHLQTSCEII